MVIKKHRKTAALAMMYIGSLALILSALIRTKSQRIVVKSEAQVLVDLRVQVQKLRSSQTERKPEATNIKPPRKELTPGSMGISIPNAENLFRENRLLKRSFVENTEAKIKLLYLPFLIKNGVSQEDR